MINLGDKAQDTISGFEGIVTGRAEYLYGCVRVLIEPEGLTENGSPQEAQWFDEQRVDGESKAEAGGPQKDAPKP